MNFWQYRHHRRWRKLLDAHPLIPTDSASVVPNLLACWKGLPVEKLGKLPLDARIKLTLNVRLKNLPSLLAAFEKQNQLITQHNDHQLESIARTFQQEGPESVVLDYYLTDNQRHRIHLKHHLQQCVVVLQAHHQLLANESNFYYQRLTEPLYFDMIAVTESLIAAHGPLEQQESYM